MNSRLFFLINHEWTAPWLDPIMQAFNYWGHPAIVWLGPLAALYVLNRRDPSRFKKDALYLTATLAAAVVLNYLVKFLVNAPRPLEALQGTGGQVFPVRVLRRADDRWRFPSGHTERSFAAAAALWRNYPKLGLILLALALLTAYSCMYVGMHFPADIMAGAALGVAVGGAGSWMRNRRP